MSFQYGIRPHGNAAAAARYYDRLVRGELRGRKPTPAEARAIVAARDAYVRACVAFARADQSHEGMYRKSNVDPAREREAA